MDCCCLCSVAYAIGAYILYKILDYLYRKPMVGSLGDKYIFITGCDTGFGYEAAKRLDKMGCNVIAGCFSESGEDNLRKQCSSRYVYYVCGIFGKARWAPFSASHHIKPEPLGEVLMR